MMILKLSKIIHTHLLGVFLLSLLALCSCSDDLLHQGVGQGQLWEGDGRQVNVALSFSFPQPEQYTNTRALDEQAERFINDIAVAFFPVSGDAANPTVGNVAFLQYFGYDDIHKLEDVTSDNHFNRGWVSVSNIPTGSYYIVGFANVESGSHEGFLDKLQAARTWEDFQHLQVKLKQDEGQVINLDRTRLCMSGYFHGPDYTDGSTDHPSPAVVTQSGDISGYIHLRRLDAKIKFIIQNEIPNCTSFNLTGWKMCKVPSASNLMEQDSDASGIDYQNTDFRQFWTFKPKKAGATAGDPDQFDHFDFTFYMFENRKAPLQAISKYSDREQENKEADGSNKRDGEGNRVYNYVNADPNSSYLVFEANMEQVKTDAQVTYPRTAQMQYVVHLGYCEPKDGTEADRASDFNTRRNSEYTYVIHIVDVNKIVVEAKGESTDYMHGVEGIVVDMVGGQVEQLDTHYGVFNVTLTRKEIHDMLLDITSVLGTQKMVLADNQSLYSHSYADYLNNPSSITPNLNYKSEDYQAYRFAALTGDVTTDLVSYSQTYDYDCATSIPTNTTMLPPHGEKKQKMDDSHTVPLYDLIGLKNTYGRAYNASTNPLGMTDANQNDPLHFTVFVNEYYYYYKDGQIPNTRTLDSNGSINTSTEGNVVNQEQDMWKRIANKRSHRFLRLYAKTTTSTDKDSHYVTGKLIVEQRAPQTYYSDKVNIAVALEHINEHHWKLIEATRGENGNHGWLRTYNFLNGKDWGQQNKKLGDGYPAFKTYNGGSGNSYYGARYGTNNNDRFTSDKWSGRDVVPSYVLCDNTKYNVLDAALSRNRDLDRNGTVSDKEIRWYTPFVQQYVDFAVGQGALETPLFSRRDADPAIIGQEQVYANRRFHYLALNKEYIWSEEGTSTGGGTYGWEIRCCRIMGTEDYSSNLNLAIPYQYDSATRIFNTDRYAENGIHRGYALSDAMLPHDNLDLQSNALPYYFKMAKQDAPLADVVPAPQQETLWNRMISNDYCRTYSEDSEGRDLGKWHVPNQMEMALMFYGANLRVSDGQYLTSTYWWRNEDVTFKEGSVANQNNNWRHFMGANSSNLRMLHTGNSMGGKLRVRCVIDVDKYGNPAGTPEYGNIVNFQPGDFTANYVGDNVNMRVGASIENGVFQSVTIDGITATSTSGLSISSQVSNAPVTKSVVTVTWKIKDTNNKILSFSKDYTLPARYWVISRYGYTNRYAMVNVENNQTTVGATYNGNLDNLDAVYKWVITTSPTTSPTNVSNLSIGTTYYLYNAGAKAYISDVAKSRTYMGVGGTAVTMQLQTRAGDQYNGYYVIRMNNSTNINSFGGNVGNFGSYDGVDDGSTYLLTPVVLKGEMPLQFTFDSDYVVSGSNYSVSIQTDPTAVIGSVTIGGHTATVTGSAGNYTATVAASAISSSASTIETVWNVTKGSDSYVKRKTYYRHIKYYVISSETGPQQYAYADGNTNTTAADATPYTGDIKDLDANHQWIFATTKTTGGTVPVNANVFSNLDAVYYMYNKGTGTYITGPLDLSTFGYLTVGTTAEDRMRVKVESRSGGKYSFQFSQSGIPNHCITTNRRNGGNTWLNDPAVFGIFQTGSRDNPQYRFYLHPIYE